MEQLFLYRVSVKEPGRGGGLYWGLRATFNINRRLWKRSISFIRVHKGSLRHLPRKGSANMFIGLVLAPYFWPQHSKGHFCLGSGKLDTGVIKKTRQSSILASFKAVGLGYVSSHPLRKGQRIKGHNGSV